MRVLVSLCAAILLVPAWSQAAETFCEPAGTDCRARLLPFIRNERMRLDLATEEITDPLIVDAIIARFRAGVPVRMLVEPRRNGDEPLNGPALAKLKAAGVPMRYKSVGDVLHWKMMIFAGQHTVEFGAAQFTQKYLVPVQPFVNFTQDPIVFSNTTAIVQSFERKFDDAWTDVVNFSNYGNAAVVSPVYGAFPIHPSLNFVPAENFGARAKLLYDAETQAIDVIMYKITDPVAPDAMIRAVKRGVPVRIIVEPDRYRNPANTWQAYYLDKMWAAGVQIRNRKHLGFLHQKTALLYSQTRTIFGSSNWSTASSKTQYEHNYFATDSVFFNWFRQVFIRKWASTDRDDRVRAAAARRAGLRRAGEHRGRADGHGRVVMETRALGAHGRRLSRHVVIAGAVSQERQRHAWRDQEVDSHRPAARRIVLLEDRVEDRRQQVQEWAGVEFWDVKKGVAALRTA